MAAAALRTAARHLAAPAALLAASQSSRCNEHDERLANLKAEVALLRGENARLRRALDGDGLDVEALRLRIADFAKERDWDQFHTPRNILLALVGEVGELAECFQWKGEVQNGLPGFEEGERAHVGQGGVPCACDLGLAPQFLIYFVRQFCFFRTLFGC